MTKEKAVRNWVIGFNAVPTRMIGKLWELEPEDWQEVTCAGEADCAGESTSGEADCAEALEAENALPMWGTMWWSFEDKADDHCWRMAA